MSVTPVREVASRKGNLDCGLRITVITREHTKRSTLNTDNGEGPSSPFPKKRKNCKRSTKQTGR
jgi:hypothetical protein